MGRQQFDSHIARQLLDSAVREEQNIRCSSNIALIDKWTTCRLYGQVESPHSSQGTLGRFRIVIV